LDLSVVGASFLGRINSLGGRTGQLLFNLRLLAVGRLLLVLLEGLHARQSLLVVRLGLLLDAAQKLGLALLSALMLLLDGLLHPLLLGSLPRVTPLADEHHLLVLLACFPLDLSQLLLALGLGGRQLLAQLFNDALALGSVLR